MTGLDDVMARVDTLPAGVQDEIRRAMRALLDVVGPGAVRVLEIAETHGAVGELLDDPDVAALLALCGLEPSRSTPVSLSTRPGCELCGHPMGSDHDHAADVTDRRLLCLCRGCALTLHGGGRYRTLPAEAQRLADADEPPAWWDEIGVPVEIAFFLRTSGAGEPSVTAFYPGSAGVVESTLDVGELPVELADDVEALLVRHGTRFEAWRVPVDRCYELAGVLRHGPAGVPPDRLTEPFFDRLRLRSAG